MAGILGIPPSPQVPANSTTPGEYPIEDYEVHLETRAVLVLMLLSLATSCATQNELPPVPLPGTPSTAPAPSLQIAPPPNANPSKEVRASYQGSSQAGHVTASGEPYDPNDLKAASRTLPIGSSVIVTNPATGRSAKVSRTFAPCTWRP